ncbi:uncharacterized protein LOC110111334 [Dendrobium catenatum]|uniref:uncharacterized protein LOC110111334 n=1 Tax=Dendrobium catenatum TaxID=906689 RepID=UPI0009F6C782|nr:uncharacterized protein LOC110111334 [Dendrobium catenatum]
MTVLLPSNNSNTDGDLNKFNLLEGLNLEDESYMVDDVGDLEEGEIDKSSPNVHTTVKMEDHVRSKVVIGQLKMHNGSEWLIATAYGSKEEEKRGGKRFVFPQGPQDMQMFMKRCDFHDIGIIGPKFTWCNNKIGGARILERLDRCLLNSAALNIIQSVAVRHLGRISSDHCPIAISICGSEFKKNRRLKFEEIWISYLASKGIVANSWNKPSGGDDVQKLNLKLKRVLKALFHWSKAKHANLNILKDNLKAEIMSLQEEEDNSGSLSKDKIALLRFKIKELNSTLGRLSSWWRQRAKIKWYKESDSNSENFHSVASARRNFNFIKQIESSDGSLTENKSCIEEIFSNYFHDKWKFRTCSFSGWPSISRIIEEPAKERLMSDFTEEELENVI